MSRPTLGWPCYTHWLFVIPIPCGLMLETTVNLERGPWRTRTPASFHRSVTSTRQIEMRRKSILHLVRAYRHFLWFFSSWLGFFNYSIYELLYVYGHSISLSRVHLPYVAPSQFQCNLPWLNKLRISPTKFDQITVVTEWVTIMDDSRLPEYYYEPLQLGGDNNL